jgi:bacterioferritin
MKDVTTRVVLERILAQEEEHANDMHDLLVTHEGRPTERHLYHALHMGLALS